MSGKKTVEFRKRGFARPVSHVAVYATAPVQRLVGVFQVSTIDTDEPKALWSRYRDVGSITKRDFDAYFASADAGAAILIDDVKAISPPASLASLGDLRPPQSFVYLGAEATARLTSLGADLLGPTEHGRDRRSRPAELLRDVFHLLAALPQRLAKALGEQVAAEGSGPAGDRAA